MCVPLLIRTTECRRDPSACGLLEHCVVGQWLVDGDSFFEGFPFDELLFWEGRPGPGLVG